VRLKSKKVFALTEWMNGRIYIPIKRGVDLMDRSLKKSSRQSNCGTMVSRWLERCVAEKRGIETTNQKVRWAVKSAFAETAYGTIARRTAMKKIWTSAWIRPLFQNFFLSFEFYPIRTASDCTRYRFNRNKHNRI